MSDSHKDFWDWKGEISEKERLYCERLDMSDIFEEFFSKAMLEKFGFSIPKLEDGQSLVISFEKDCLSYVCNIVLKKDITLKMEIRYYTIFSRYLMTNKDYINNCIDLKNKSIDMEKFTILDSLEKEKYSYRGYRKI